MYNGDTGYTIEDHWNSQHTSDVFIGDMLENVKEGYIIHGCNAQGVMGAGIAKLIKSYWPEVYQEYMRVHETTGLKLGTIIPVSVSPDLMIVNCITQDNCGTDRRHVSYDAVTQCAERLNEFVDAMRYKPIIHTPLIGAGLAGGDWGIIEMILLRTIKHKMLIWALTDEAYLEACK